MKIVLLLRALRVSARYIPTPVLTPLRSLRLCESFSSSKRYISSELPPERRAVRGEDMRRTRRRELVSVSCGVGAELASVLR